MLRLLPRFWDKVSVEPSGCWPWMGQRDRDGYGGFHLDGKREIAHRLSYQHFKGDIPNGIYICHKCDNPSCVNPSHLWTGTHADNMADKVSKGRAYQPIGDKNKSAKLVEADVIAIRADTRPQHQIAADYGIDQAQVSNIKLRKSWNHIDD